MPLPPSCWWLAVLGHSLACRWITPLSSCGLPLCVCVSVSTFLLLFLEGHPTPVSPTLNTHRNHICIDYFRRRLHLQVPVKTSIYLFAGHNSTHTTKSPICLPLSLGLNGRGGHKERKGILRMVIKLEKPQALG